MNAFPEMRRKFGFGCMRLPMQGEKVDGQAMCAMVDAFLAAGFNYFDTAHGYLSGKSETALRECLTKRYPRSAYLLTDKLTGNFFEKEEDIRPFFESQLAACGVDYFDFYLMHAQNKDIYAKFKRCHAYEQGLQLKAEGKIRHFGISFHDTAEVLEQILTEYPQIEVVQIQLNYLDFEDPAVQSRRCYEVCCKHGKPVIVMEPVKGGSLVNLPVLHRRLPPAYFHPRSVLLPERQAAAPRLECRLLLRHLHRQPRQGVRLHRLRQVRKCLPPASAHPGAAEGCGKGV